MVRTVIDVAGFDAKFQADPDPWNYRHSPFEAFKRRILLQACGARQYGRVLELACANGETSLLLARRSLRLLAVDGSATAVAVATQATGGLDRVQVRLAALPRRMPRGPFGLIVISELLYYLSPRDFGLLLEKCRLALAPGGRVVLLHHTIFFDDAAIAPAIAQQHARAFFARSMKQVHHRALAHFDVAAFEKPLR